MKKYFAILLVVTALLTLSGCGSNSVPTEKPAPAVSSGPTAAVPSAGADLPAAPAPAAAPSPAPSPAPVQKETPASEIKAPGAVDVDLTQLSSTMVYSEVYAMMYEPEQYTGKTVKLRGLFATQVYNGARLFACVVQDATACCAQGLEFEMAEELVYPDDYPEPGTEITVVGTFDSYVEEHDGNNYIYLLLRNARFV